MTTFETNGSAIARTFPSFEPSGAKRRVARARTLGSFAWKALGVGFVAATALAIAPVALAANADTLQVDVTIKPIDDVTGPTVSVSRSGLDSFLSVRLTVKNGGTNTINKVVLKGTTTVLQGTDVNPLLSSLYVQFIDLGTQSPNCTQPTNPPTTTTVTCTIGQLSSQESRDFFLIFKAPTTGDKINYHQNTTFSSGNSPNTPPAIFFKDRDFPVNLITTDTFGINHKIKTVLPPLGGDFFTGQNGTTDSLNPYSTRVTVPTIPTMTSLVTDNSIFEDIPAPVACPTPDNPSYFCFGFKSTIEVTDASKAPTDPGYRVYIADASADVLKIKLRQDVTALGAKPYPAIGTIKIFYQDVLGNPKFQIKDCSTDSTLPKANVPCIQSRTDAVKGNKGYYEYLIYAKDNGFYTW